MADLAQARGRRWPVRESRPLQLLAALPGPAPRAADHGAPAGHSNAIRVGTAPRQGRGTGGKGRRARRPESRSWRAPQPPLRSLGRWGGARPPLASGSSDKSPGAPSKPSCAPLAHVPPVRGVCLHSAFVPQPHPDPPPRAQDGPRSRAPSARPGPGREAPWVRTGPRSAGL